MVASKFTDGLSQLGWFTFTGDPKKTLHLTSLDGAKQRLELFKADLLEEGSFDSVVEGCEGVFHLASPCVAQVNDPEVHFLLTSSSSSFLIPENYLF